MSALETEGSGIPEQLVDQLLRGYESLLAEVKTLNERSAQLENKVSWAKQQYLDVLKRLTPDIAITDFKTFLVELDEAGACEREGSNDWLEAMLQIADGQKRSRACAIQTANDARDKIKLRNRISEADGGSVAIMNGRHADFAAIEKDFTTSGVPGKLGCPFNATRAASSSSPRGITGSRSSISRGSRASHSGRRSKRASFHDPIRAEVCGNITHYEPSVEGSVPLCPIRFLDKHSPEELAQYFEKHKHELPRSHEVCIKRFQENQDAIEQLDSKYKSVVSMVTELSKFHKPLMPDPDEIEIEDEDCEAEDPAAKVEDWARNISPTLGQEEEITPGMAEQTREGRSVQCDRPLKDVRLGESPSRPWGIAMPEADDTKSINSDHTASPLEPGPGVVTQAIQSAEPTKKCPFSKMMAWPDMPLDHPVVSPSNPTAQREEPTDAPVASPSLRPASPSRTKSKPQIVFNGPVFFGYPPEQALSMLRSMGLGGDTSYSTS